MPLNDIMPCNIKEKMTLVTFTRIRSYSQPCLFIFCPHWNLITGVGYFTPNPPPPQKTGPSKARNKFFFLPQSGYDFMSEPFDWQVLRGQAMPPGNCIYRRITGKKKKVGILSSVTKEQNGGNSSPLLWEEIPSFFFRQDRKSIAARRPRRVGTNPAGRLGWAE